LKKASELGDERASAFMKEYCLEKIESVQSEIHKIVERDSNYYLKNGIEKYDKSDYNSAIIDFDEVIRLDVNYTTAYYYKGLSYTGLDRFEDAIASFDIALRKANILYKLGGNGPDIKNTNLHLFDTRLVAKIYFQRGYLYSIFKKDYLRSTEEYTESIRYYDGDSMTFNNRGKNRDRLKDYKGAIDDFNKAFELGDTSIYYSRGLAKCKMNKFEDAIDDLTKAIELNPTEAVYYYERGVARHSIGKYTEATMDYQKTIELRPKYLNAYFMNAQLKSQLKDNIGAINDYTMVIKIDPKDEAAYYYRGIEKHKIGRLEDAREDLITAGKLGNKRGPEYINKYF
jgi:tetratricopeptide (TPR) repeat protein